jgi:hypothetical protein
VPAGEELTYDYRFSGDEQLPCNCGAATCRGFVNVDADDDDEGGGGAVVEVPRSLLMQ